MGQFRARDVLLPPGLASLLRIPLGLLFFAVVDNATLALVVIALAGGTDVIDGFLARRYDMATPTGAVLDGVTDKFFAGCVAVALFWSGLLPAWGVVLLATREIGEVPLVVWWLVSRSKRRSRSEDPKANVPGKAATTLQFLAVVACLVHSPLLQLALAAAGGAGAAAALSYWSRELRRPVTRE